MKRAALLCWALCALLGGLMLWQWSAGDLRVTGQGVRTIPADSDPAAFDSVSAAVTGGWLAGTVFDPASLKDAGRCAFQRYTLRLENPGLLPAEMVELQLFPMSGDICSYLSPDEIVIAPGSRREVTVTLLTARPDTAPRDVIITWYVWGRLHRQRYELTRGAYAP